MNNNELRNTQVKLCEWLHFLKILLVTQTHTLQSSLYEADWQDAHVPQRALIILHLSPNRFTRGEVTKRLEQVTGQ